MRKTLALLPILFIVACGTMTKPDTGPYASMDCPALEAERTRLYAELQAMPAGDIANIEATRAKIDAVGAAQVSKGCAG